MMNLSKTLLACTMVSILSGCSLLGDDLISAQNQDNAVANEFNNNDELLSRNELLEQTAVLNGDAGFTAKYRQLLKQNQLREQRIKKLESHKIKTAKPNQQINQDLNFYVRRLMQDLVSNLQFVNDKTPVAVTDFALLDSDLQTTNLLGYQITESLVHEIHKFGIPIIDFKSTGYISVTEEGDFLLTRNYQELSGNLPIRYVFTGTLTKHENGYLVNAKVLGVESKAIVGSAQSFIPNEVSDALIGTEKTQAPEVSTAVSLIQG